MPLPRPGSARLRAPAPVAVASLAVMVVAVVAATVALAGCAEDPSPVVEPAVGDWSAVERDYVAEIRENAPAGRIADDDAAVP